MLLLLFGKLLPLDEALVPLLCQQVDRRGSVIHHDLGRDVRAEAILLGLHLNPTPDVEIGGFLGARHVAGRKLRDLHQPGLDRIQQAEIRNNPRKRLAYLVPGALDVEGSC